MITAKELTTPNETPHVYKDLDLIRLVYEDGQIVGWYRPDGDPEVVEARKMLNMLKLAAEMLE